MNAALDMVVGMTRSWVAVYTSSLPPELRSARRAEIDSDLWEHQRTARLQDQPPGETAFQLLARLVLGVPSDVTWRLETGRSVSAEGSITMNESALSRGVLAIALLVALVPVWGGIGMLAGGGNPDSNAGTYIWAIGSAAAGIGIMAGLLLCTRRPLLGVGLVAAGAIAIAAMWYWMLAITIPVGIAIAAIAYFRARQTGGAVGIGADRMRAKGESQWRWLLLVIGVCVATFVGMWSYALSLEEWGDARVMIFGLGSLLAVTVGLIALVLLISDLMGSARRKTDS